MQGADGATGWNNFRAGMMLHQDYRDMMIKDPPARAGVGRPGQSPADANETATMLPNRGLGEEALHRIVVVGGGAAGLELVTRLGDRLGRRRSAGRASRWWSAPAPISGSRCCTK